MMMNTKGQITDLIYVLIILFSFALLTILGYYLFNQFNTTFANTEGVSNFSLEIMNENKDRYVSIFDGIMLFIFVGLLIASIVSAIFIKSHPIFFVINVFLLIIVSIIAIILKSVFTGFATSSEMINTTSEFTIIPFIMNNLTLILVIAGFLIIIALLGKRALQDVF